MVTHASAGNRGFTQAYPPIHLANARAHGPGPQSVEGSVSIAAMGIWKSLYEETVVSGWAYAYFFVMDYKYTAAQWLDLLYCFMAEVFRQFQW